MTTSWSGKYFIIIIITFKPSTSAGSSDLGVWEAWATAIPLGHLFSCLLCSFPYLLFSYLYFYVLFHSSGSHGQVFGKILIHKFHISYSHTEWNLLSSLCKNGDKIWGCVLLAKLQKRERGAQVRERETHQSHTFKHAVIKIENIYCTIFQYNTK